MERTTLGELASWEPPPDEIDYEYYHRFINVIDEFYPDDWRSWEVNNVSYEDLFGDRISSDEENRLRFAVPTLHLAYAFSEGQPSLSERRYKRIKRYLIMWPLGRAIIYRPFATMKKIHPNDMGNRFSELLSELKAQLISRAEAAKILLSTQGKFRTPFTIMPSTSQKRTCSSTDPAPFKKSRNEIDCVTVTDFMKQQNDMLQKLCKLSEKQNKSINQICKKISIKTRDCLTSESDDSGDEEGREPSCDRELSEEVESLTNELDEDSPKVLEEKEIEATQNVADEGIFKEGIVCQRLGTDSWNNINYTEGQKQLEAAPVFANLKINSSLTKETPPGQIVSVLENMDLCLGTITHGLLQQRKQFHEIYTKGSLEVKSVLYKYFLAPESTCRKSSDNHLRYTCGKRADIIQQRRSLYKPTSKILHDLLHSIPPSSTHLFSEPKLSEFLEVHGGIDKIFPVIYKPEESRKCTSQTSGVGEKPQSSKTCIRPCSKATERPTYTRRTSTRSAVKQKNLEKSKVNANFRADYVIGD